VPVLEAERLCRRLIQRLREATVNRRDETVPQMVACLAAIKAGTVLPPDRQQPLLEAWGKSANPHACAHNRPVYTRIQLDEVRQKIGRTAGGCGEPS
jgi:DNA mismatch repair protein MutL